MQIAIFLKILYAVVFLLLCIGLYCVFSSISIREQVSKNMSRIYADLRARDSKRVSELEYERRKSGAIEKRGFIGNALMGILDKMDSLIMYSGLFLRYPWLNTSTFFALMIVLVSVLFLVVLFVTTSVLLAVILSVIISALPIFYMIMLRDRNYQKTEEQLPIFVNIVANNAAGTNDMVALLDESGKFLGEPLRSAIDRAVADARLGSGGSDCIRQLAKEIEHPSFNLFLRNLESCSRADADYGKVARDYIVQVEMAVRYSERQKAIARNGRMDILALLLVGVVLVITSSSLMGGGVFSVIRDMQTNLFGQIVLAYNGIAIGGIGLFLIFGLRR